LATVKRDVPLDRGVDDLAYHGPRRDVAGDLFARLNFRRLSQDLAFSATESPDTTVGQQAKASEDRRQQFRTVQSMEELAAAVAACQQAGCFAFDTETT